MKTFRNLIECMDYFKSPQVCREYLVNLRWSNGIACPHCGSTHVYTFKDGKTYKCAEKECKMKFNVLSKTIFENTKIPLQKWFAALYLITSHKKGISSIQVGKDISVTQKTAWFMMHRLRFMFAAPALNKPLRGIVEVDETFVGGKLSNKRQHLPNFDRFKYYKGKNYKGDVKDIVVGAVARDGRVITRVINAVSKENLFQFIKDNIKNGTMVVTDELQQYKALPKEGYKHNFVRHGVRQYIKGNAHTNTIEGVWGLFKRSIIGIYHHVSSKHLQRYTTETSFRYNTRKIDEKQRFNVALKMCEGRLKYNDLIV